MANEQKPTLCTSVLSEGVLKSYEQKNHFAIQRKPSQVCYWRINKGAMFKKLLLWGRFEIGRGTSTARKAVC